MGTRKGPKEAAEDRATPGTHHFLSWDDRFLGLAASSCSFTFSSTRGRKTPTDAGQKTSHHSPMCKRAAAVPREGLRFLALTLPSA